MISSETLIQPITSGLDFARRDSPGEYRRVLHIVNGEHYAGAARVQDLLALSLPKFGYHVEFACVLPDRFAAERQSQNSRLYNFPMKHRLDFGPARRIADLVRSQRYALIHSHTTRSAMMATVVARMTQVPYVHHVHCQMNTEVGRRFRTLMNTSIERFACRSADRVIAVSESILRFLIRRNVRTGISVVPNGVPQQNGLRPPRHGSDPWVIGLVALLRERKGLETMLRALPQLAARHDVRLKIVGPFENPRYEQTIHELVQQLGISRLIEWTGFVRDVHREVAGMDVLVLPSVLPEGMPMVLLEAMSAGVPIVGSRVDGITDVIEHDANGLLVEPGDPGSLAAELGRLISGDIAWSELRRHGIQDYHDHYSDVAMARETAKVYDAILGQPQRHASASKLTTA